MGYTRVGTEEQARDGVSLGAHKDKSHAYAVVKDGTLTELIHNAGHSAKSHKRPGMARLLALAEAGQMDAVMVYKLERLTRSVVALGG